MPEISCIRNRYRLHERGKCNEKGSFSKLQLSGYSEKIILKSDSIERNKKMSDFLIFVKDGHFILVVLELKEKNFKCKDVFLKISNGAELLNEIFDSCCNSSKIKKYDFYPLLLHHGVRSPAEIKMLRTHSITFKRKPYWVICEEGKKELSEIIRTY